MLRTGKPRTEGQIFHRRLLSEYIADFTLENYVAYFELKKITKRIDTLRQDGEKKVRDGLKGFPVPSSATAAGFFTRANSPTTSSSPTYKPLVRPGSVSVFVDPVASPVVNYFSPIALQEELIAADPSLASLFAEIEKLQKLFFETLQRSYQKVKRFLIDLEKDIVLEMVNLHKLTEEDLRAKEKDYIPKIYLKLESVVHYRELNLLAFRKILRKFLERCARDSLELQHRTMEIDNIISRSNVSQPTLDLREISLELTAIYGTVYKLTYEATLAAFDQYVTRSGRLQPRILPMSYTFFSTNQIPFPPHQERPGSFAVRVLAGSKSLLAEKMVTEVLQCPRYAGQSCSKFANGEVCVNLQGKLRGDDVYIVQTLVGTDAENFSNSDAVMELLLMIHAAQLAAAARITAVIPYLAYARNVASIAALAEMIESVGCQHVVTVDMHSDQVEGMFTTPMEIISAKYEFVKYLTNELRNQGNDFTNLTIVAPSGNYLGKAKDFADTMMRYGKLDSKEQFVSVCTAVKRLLPRSQPQHPHPRANAVLSPTTAPHPGTQTTAALHRAVCVGANDTCAGLPYVHSISELQSPLRIPAGLPASSPSPVGKCPPPQDSASATHASTSASASASAGAAAAVAESSYADPLASPSTPERADALNGDANRAGERSGSDPEHTVTQVGDLDNALFNSAAARSLSPSTPNVADMQLSELSGSPAELAARLCTSSPAEMEERSGSTLGFEKAIRRQAEGRRAVVTHQIEETRNEYENFVLVGDVRGRLCIILDTIIDEAVNICQVAKSLHANGAERIFLVATHAVLSGKYRERVLDAPIEMIIVSDSVNQDEAMRDPELAKRFRTVSIAPLLARAIEKIHSESTLTTLFDR